MKKERKHYTPDEKVATSIRSLHAVQGDKGSRISG